MIRCLLVLVVTSIGCKQHDRHVEPSASARMVCWGSDHLGQLGASRSNEDLHPVTEGSDATDILAYESASCARTNAGPWRCWGGHDASFDPLFALPDVDALDAGMHHACALRHDGTVACTGDDARGVALADAHIADPRDDTKTLYAIRTDGSNTTFKPVGPAPAPINVDIPSVVTIAHLTDAIELSLGTDHACARRRNGDVVCWGDGKFGQLGAGDIARSAVPRPVAAIADATAIASGGSYSCAVRRDGTVWCWGTLESSISRPEPHGWPQPIAGVTGATSVAITTDAMGDDSRACAVVAGGRAMCWTKDKPATPVDGVIGVTQLVAGMGHFCGRLGTGRVACWGPDGSATGPHDLANPSPEVVGLTRVSRIVAGARHTCVLLERPAADGVPHA